MEALYERVLIIGDSFARDLQLFQEGIYPSGVLFVHGCAVEVFGKSGANVDFVGTNLVDIPVGHYSVIVLMCGSNDLCSLDRLPHIVADDLMSLSRFLIMFRGVTRVVICELLHRSKANRHFQVSLNSKRLTRNCTGGFDSRTMCILCGQDVDMSDKFKAKRRKVETHTIVQTWCEVCENRNDQWGQEVAARLEFLNKDLVAADAIYHKNCADRFRSCLTKQPGVSKVGRPSKEIATDAFNVVCRHLEASCESGLYTVKELHEMMVNYIRTSAAKTTDENENETTKSEKDLADTFMNAQCEVSNDVDDDYDESSSEIVHDLDFQESINDNDIEDDASAYLEDSEQSQAEFDAYSKKYFLFKLKQRYGQHLYITHLHGRKNVVCFSNLVSVIIQETWKQQQNQEQCSSAEALIRNAARLIAAQIREMEFDLSKYPATDDILQGAEFPIPPLVKTFMECLIKDKMKRAGVSQALVQCARPKTALLPLQYGLAVHLDRFASAELVKEVSRFGFCVSHDEVNRFKQSAAQIDLNRLRQVNGLQPLQIQFVADNVDHNSRTLDGSGTLHAMGIISAAYVKKGNFSGESFRIPRLSKRLLAADVCKHEVVPILAFTETPGAHLANLQLDSIDKLITIASPSALHKLNNIWNVGLLLDNGNRPSWSGFMQLVTRGDHPSPSVIDFLPIVNLPPTDVNCILSTLVFIEDQAKAMNVHEPCVTFDQPLYVKALDVILAKNLKLVVRLGGFHTALSYLGSIGNLMRGSGLEDILSVLYGKNVVENILQGRDYERAVRGHFLIHSALNALLTGVLVKTECSEENNTVCFEDSEQVGKYHLDASDIASLTSLHKQALEQKVWLTNDNDCTNGAISLQSLQSSSLDKFHSNMAELRTKLSGQSRTSRLWILYMKCVELLKFFLMAERTSNWLLHLECLHGMLALFAATGHVHYAKSVRLYLQFMKNLLTSHPSLHEQFMSGMHTIRRSDRYWAGLSCDLVIEQTLMRSLKSRGGLTRGRGTHDTVRNLWLKSMSECARVSAAVATVIGLNQVCSDNVETGKSRIARDNADLRKLVDFLTVNSPFRFVDSARIVSLLNGVSAGPDDGVTCDIADEVGLRIHESWNDVTYGSVTLHKTSRVKTLANMHNLFKVDDETTEIDANSLFHRLVVLAQRSENQAACFEFELAPFPTALFKDGFMRKPDKPALYREFAKNMTSQPVPLRKFFVIDGGCLLHRVRWTRGTVAGDIMHLYVRYIDCHFGKSSVVVFDGYDAGMTIKDHEHMRRAGKVSRIAADVKLELSTEIVFDQDAFLANPRNKQSFINSLSDCLNASNIEVVRSIGDADTDIAVSALKLADNGKTAVVWADDTDISALLINHRTQDMADICFLSEAKGKVKGRNESKCISVAAIQQKLGSYASRHILVAHAFGGCDTTSAIFGQGKGTVFKKVTQNKLLETSLLVMENMDASVADVTLAGLKIMSVVYGANGEESMGRMRYNCYNRLVTSNFGRFQAERLPPSQNATELHALRVHLQTVYWLTLGKVNLKAEEWGWKIKQGKLMPIQMTVKPGPDFLMSVIRCNCSSKGKCSSKQCSCVKNKLKCIAACGSCHGMDCANADDVIKLLDDSCTDDLIIDTNELTDVMDSDQLLFEREEDFYESYDDGSACEFIFDSQVEAELATHMEEVV